ncbi:RICIN domain-containing protein [Ruminococcus albus]|uniref:RICIN domain-containing protein n=1 Tax=Ruminococcus albus TaxID=1264 RepID=UPI000466C9CB|nr:RICIN domain-containing protein [Ruminococcus albus]
MMKLSKSVVSIFMTIVVVISILPMSAFAASDYWNYPTPTRTLSMGCRGDDVKWLQCAINDLITKGDWKNSHLKTSELDVDGAFGSATRTAVYDFQRTYNLTVDGYFGPDSLTKMLKVLYPRINNNNSQTNTQTNSEPKIPDAKNYNIDGTYYIRNKKTNKYLDVMGGSSYNNAKIVQYRFHGDLNQQFYIKYVNGFYKIYSMGGNSSRCFDLSGPSEANTNGTNLKIYDNVSNCVQQNFILKRLNDGSYEIGSASSNCNKVLEVENSSYDDCATVKIWEGNGSKLNDDWYLEPINDYTTKAPNQFNRAGNIYTLGSVNYGGYRYKIVTKDNVPSGMEKVDDLIRNKRDIDLWKAIADFEIQTGTDYLPAMPKTQTIFGITNTLAKSQTYAKVKITLYKSKTSNFRCATIEVFDSELFNRLINDTGYLKTNFTGNDGRTYAFKDENGRLQGIYMIKQHIYDDYQYDGYFDTNGEFCLAFHTYVDDYVAVCVSGVWNKTWSKYARFTYGTDNRSASMFTPIKASDNFANLLNQCIQ